MPLWSRDLRVKITKEKETNTRCAQLNTLASLEASCSAFSAYTGSYGLVLALTRPKMARLTLGISYARLLPPLGYDEKLIL